MPTPALASTTLLHGAILVLVAGIGSGCATTRDADYRTVDAGRPPLPVARAIEHPPEELDGEGEGVPWLQPLPTSALALLHPPGCPPCDRRRGRLPNSPLNESPEARFLR